MANASRSKYPHCVLCPNKPAKSYDAPLTALDCLKPTEMQKYVALTRILWAVADGCPCHSYVHLICAVWHPELKLSDPTELRFIEGLPNLPSRRKRAVRFCAFIWSVAGLLMACVGPDLHDL